MRYVAPHVGDAAQVERDGERLITMAWRAHTVLVRTINLESEGYGEHLVRKRTRLDAEENELLASVERREWKSSVGGGQKALNG